jgi:hypothetical protein
MAGTRQFAGEHRHCPAADWQIRIDKGYLVETAYRRRRGSERQHDSGELHQRRI